MTYESYRWKWNNRPKLKVAGFFPIHLDFELVRGICNCRCVMCEMSFNPPAPLMMPFKRAKKIIKQFAKGGGCSIKFVYLGEPLYYEKLPKLIKYAKKKGIIETMIATNGGLLTKDWSKRLIKSGLDWIIFSVDSCKPEIYKQIRVNGNLKIVGKNIWNFHKIRNELNSKKPKISIQCIRMDLNEEEIKSGEYLQFWSPYVDDVSISTLVDWHLNDISGESPNFCCTSPFRRLTIRANGDIAICCGQYIEGKIIGNINKMSIEEAWNGKKFNKLRKLMREGKAHLIDICKNCPTRLIDMQGDDRFEKIKG